VFIEPADEGLVFVCIHSVYEKADTGNGVETMDVETPATQI